MKELAIAVVITVAVFYVVGPSIEEYKTVFENWTN